MATTAEALRNRVLQKLKVLAVGETADTDDATLVDGVYTNVYAMLRKLHRVNWGPSDSIPTEMVEPVAAIVANRLTDEFSVPLTTQAKIAQEAAGAVPTIVALMAEDQTDLPIRTEYL